MTKIITLHSANDGGAFSVDADDIVSRKRVEVSSSSQGDDDNYGSSLTYKQIARTASLPALVLETPEMIDAKIARNQPARYSPSVPPTSYLG